MPIFSNADKSLSIERDWDVPTPHHSLAARSIDAVQIAAELPTKNGGDIANWLYWYGQVPRNVRELTSNLPLHSVLSPRDRFELESLYACRSGSEWSCWEYRETEKALKFAESPRYKLYVSPARAALGDAFRATVSLLLESPVPAFKHVTSIDSACRPDKIIVYFWNNQERESWMRTLVNKLDGLEGQGVLFTEAQDLSGILSLAIDPPLSGSSVIHSWRSLITFQIAHWLVAARESESLCQVVAPWTFALYQLSLINVDVGRWKLTCDDWPVEVGS